MENFPTQTDPSKLLMMSPFHQTAQCGIQSLNWTDNMSEVDSVISNSSRNEDQITKKVSAGLDMRRGEYKEVDFLPMPLQNKKSTTIVGLIKEPTPSPVDLCTTQHPASETQKLEKKRKFVAGTFLHSFFDDIRHMKHRRTEDTHITPAHQSNSTSVGPWAFMSTSSAVVGLPVTTTPVCDLSMKGTS